MPFLMERKQLAGGDVVTLVLNRPQASNALSDELIQRLNATLAELASDDSIRFLVLRGAGKNFCAGADLTWMQAAAAQTDAENQKGSEVLASLFHRLKMFPAPTLCVAQGAVFGGGVGLVACCDLVLASETTKFCLSELKLGLMPAVILPYLMAKMQRSALQFYGLSARVFAASEGKDAGLVNIVASAEQLETQVLEVANLLLQCGPQASREFKALMHSLWPSTNESVRATTVAAIAKRRSSAEAQHGIASFFAKKAPDWSAKI